MPLATALAEQIRGIYFGNNWTDTNVKSCLKNITWQEANIKVHNFNTILALTYHINYYVKAALMVLKAEPLNAHDKFSFDHPTINSEKEWEDFLDQIFNDAELFASLVEQLAENKIWDIFAEIKYGTYYKNITGCIEHTFYHLGQIVLIKKLFLQICLNLFCRKI